jgi:hypothetical protein
MPCSPESGIRSAIDHSKEHYDVRIPVIFATAFPLCYPTIVEPGGSGYPHIQSQGVGGEVETVSKFSLIFPWLALAFTLVLGGILFMLNRHRRI